MSVVDYFVWPLLERKQRRLVWSGLEVSLATAAPTSGPANSGQAQSAKTVQSSSRDYEALSLETLAEF